MEKDQNLPPLEVNKGWYKLVEDTVAMMRFVDPEVSFTQIKEKFAELRVYHHTGSDNPLVWEILNAIVDSAESKSRYICEVCGKFDPGFGDNRVKTRSKGGWLKTLCDVHAKELGYEKELKKGP